MKVKRLFGLVLSLGIIAASVVPFGNAYANEGTASDGAVYCFNMAEDESLWVSDPWENGAAHSFAYVDEAHGGACHIEAYEGAEWPFSQFTLNNGTGGNVLENKKIGVSFQVKVTSENSEFIAFDFTAGGTDKSIFRTAYPSDGSGCWLGNNYNNPASKPLFDNGEWVDIDILIDQANKTVTAYKNGEKYHDNGGNAGMFDSSGLNSIDTFYLILYAFNKDGAVQDIYFDNFKSYDAENSDFYILNTSVADKNIYLDLSASLEKGQSVDGIKIRKVGSSNLIDVTATAIESQIIKLECAAELDGGTEYQVILPEGSQIKDVFGRTLKSDATFYIEGGERDIPLVDTDFSEGFSDISEWGHTFPDGWSMTYFSDWGDGAPNRVGTTLDGENRVYKFGLVNDTRGQREVRYDLPALPDGSTLKIKYRTLLHSVTNEAFVANRFYDASGKDAWITCMNCDNAGDQHYKGITTSCGSLWAQHGGVTLVNADSFKLDEWYTVDGTFSISGTSNAKASYKIYDKDGNLAGSIDNVNVSNSMVKPTQFALYAANNGSDNEAYAYYDDLKISYSYPINNVRTLRLENFDGNEIIPTAAPLNDMHKINVTFTGAASEVSAELKAGDNAVSLTQSGSGSAYSFEIGELLSGGTNYTFTLNFDGETYVYEFTPVSAGKILVTDFNLYKGDEALTSLEGIKADDEITAKAKLINLTGRDETACLSYSVYAGGFLKAVNFDAGTIPESATGLNLQKTFKITDGMGSIDKISVFLWKSMDSMVPITDAIDVVGK